MIRRRLLEALDLCAVPVMALALVIASTQGGAPDRERNFDRKAGVAAGGEVMMRLTDLPYGDAQGALTMPDRRSARNGLNPRQVPTPTAPDFRF